MWIRYVAEYRCPPSIVSSSEVLEFEGSVEPTSYILLGRSPACFPSPFNALAGVANGHDGNYQMTASLISVSRICSATPIAVTLSRWCQVFVGEKFCVDVQITAQPAFHCIPASLSFKFALERGMRHCWTIFERLSMIPSNREFGVANYTHSY